MSLYTTGPGGIKIHIKITIKSESIQDSYKVNTFSCQIIALHLRLYYFNLNPKYKNPTRPSDVSVHQANHAAVLYKRTSPSSKASNTRFGRRKGG